MQHLYKLVHEDPAYLNMMRRPMAQTHDAMIDAEQAAHRQPHPQPTLHCKHAVCGHNKSDMSL